MANKVLNVNGVEFSINPREKALFLASPSYFLSNVLKMTLALIFKAKSEDAGIAFSKEYLETRKKDEPAFRLVSGKTASDVLANCEDILSQLENVKAIKAEMVKTLGEYAPKAFETYISEAETFVNANKDEILAEMNKQ